MAFRGRPNRHRNSQRRNPHFH